MTTRQIESLVRLAEARARIDLRELITAQVREKLEGGDREDLEDLGTHSLP